MSQELILYPLFAMAMLTLFIAMRMYILRVRAVREGALNIGYFRMNQGAEAPAALTRTTQHYDNLFEMPVLFYVVVVLIFITSSVNTILLVLAWSYVVLRLGHAFVHVTYNNVIHRMYFFTISTLVMFGMWFIWFGKIVLT